MNIEQCKVFQKSDGNSRTQLCRCKEISLLILLGMMLGALLVGTAVLMFNSDRYACLLEEASPSLPKKSHLIQVMENIANQKQKTFHRLLSRNNLVNAAMWTTLTEYSLPIRRFNEVDRLAWKHKIATQPIVALQKGCGRMQNRLATLADGTLACVRYRQNIDQIQGEMYTHRLAELLNFGGNLAPQNLAIVDHNSEQWKRVRSEIGEAGWRAGQLVVMTQWLTNLSSVYIPWQLRKSNEMLTDENVVKEKHVFVNLSNIADLVQWSDLMLLDYITANMDRFVNSLVNQQWNWNIMSDPAHNLERVTDRNLLVFLDNESALYHGFNLLPKYSYLHEDALRRLCVFRNSTISALHKLATSNPKQLSQTLRQSMFHLEIEQLASKLPSLGHLQITTLIKRIHIVLEHFRYCQKRLF